jgi:class 3 adenylate cyclase/tetratricopeptide (TPR) repeat protein
VRCHDCGSENPDGMSFCGRCGARLRHFRPSDDIPGNDLPAVLSVPAHEDELRLVTVLFADLVGFTRLAQDTEAETVGELLNECFDRLVPCVERYGGTIDKFIGDALMALFGAPAAHENDPELAVRAALDMRRALADFSREKGLDMALHVGVNTGRVLAASVGGGNRRDYSVVGDAVNVAARLQQISEPGEILIGHDTFRLSGHLFSTEARGATKVKGRTEPVSVHKVLGLRSRAVEQGRYWMRSALIGRREERDAFEQAVTRLASGTGGVMVVLGQAGLGKSRLVAEVRSGSAGRCVDWLEGRCTTLGKMASYGPFRDLLRDDCGITPDDDPNIARARLEERLTSFLFGESDGLVPCLAALLDLRDSAAESDVRRLPAESMRKQLAFAVRRYFEEVGNHRPTVLVFEDAHWMDESSVSIMEQLLPSVNDSRLLLCLVGRPDPGSSLMTLTDRAEAVVGESLLRIGVSPLTTTEAGQLVENLAGAALPHDLLESIERKTEGNPFFIEQVMRALVDLGALKADQQGGWRAAAGAVSVSLPDTMEGLIVARIDRLPEDLRRTLKLASVIGRIFSANLLGLLDNESRLSSHLVELEDREFIHRREPAALAEYVFQHVFIQEAAYNSILARQRKEMHRRVAGAIEQLWGDRLPESVGHLAYHYSKAEDWDRARDYLVRAGEQALAMAADAEALAHFERALETSDGAVEERAATGAGLLESALLWAKVAGLRAKQHHIAEWSIAIEAAERELERCREDTPSWWQEWINVKLQRAWGLYHQGPQKHKDLEVTLNQLASVVERQGNSGQKARFLDAQIAARGSPASWGIDEVTLEMAKSLYSYPCDSGVDRAKYCFTLGFCLLLSGRAEESKAVLQESLDQAVAAGDLVQQLTTLNYLACAARAMGQIEQASELATQTLTLATDLDVRLYQATATANLSWVHWRRGDKALARQEATASLELIQPWPYFLKRLARWPLVDLLVAEGETERAVEQARALLAPPEQPLPVEIKARLADLLKRWDGGERDGIEQRLIEAHDLAHELGCG